MTCAQQAEPGFLPTVYELVQQAEVALRAAEAPISESMGRDDLRSLGHVRSDALTDLAMTLPARSAADAAAQLAVVYRTLRRLAETDVPRDDLDFELRKIRRVVFGIPAALAGESGIDLTSIGWWADDALVEFPL